jgi:hypothetical protein
VQPGGFWKGSRRGSRIHVDYPGFKWRGAAGWIGLRGRMGRRMHVVGLMLARCSGEGWHDGTPIYTWERRARPASPTRDFTPPPAPICGHASVIICGHASVIICGHATVANCGHASVAGKRLENCLAGCRPLPRCYHRSLQGSQTPRASALTLFERLTSYFLPPPPLAGREGRTGRLGPAGLHSAGAAPNHSQLSVSSHSSAP